MSIIPQVLWFAKQMEYNLENSRHKGGLMILVASWDECDFDRLYRLARNEMSELRDANVPTLLIL